MSNRKENVFNETKRSASKRRELLQRPKFGSAVCLNSTFANHTVTRAKSELPSMLVNITPSVDYESLADIEYSIYLQSLTFQQYISNQIKEVEVLLNDQLSIYTDTSSRMLQVSSGLEQEVKQYETANNVKVLLDSLDNQLRKSICELSPKTERKLIEIIQVLEQAGNHLYLNKVRTLYNQDEYNCLEKLFNRYETIVTKIVGLSGSTEKYQILGDSVRRFRTSLKEITAIQVQVDTLQDDINKLTLETVSGILYINAMKECE